MTESTQAQLTYTPSDDGLQCPVCGYILNRDKSVAFGKESVHCSRPSCGVEIVHGNQRGDISVRTFRLNHHKTLCIFPFAFGKYDQSAQDSFSKLRASRRWDQVKYNQDSPEDIERTEYFLPYARRFLFPSLNDEEASSHQAQKEPSCQHFRFNMSHLGQSEGAALPFVLSCKDDRKRATFTYNMELSDIRLSVFNYHVGFLVFTLENKDPGATYFDQMNAALYFRLIAPLYPGFEMPQLSLEDSQVQMTQLLPFLLDEFSSKPSGKKHPKDFAPDQPKRVWLPVKPFYDDRMMAYTFSCIQGHTTLTNLEQAERLLNKYSLINFNPDKQEKTNFDDQDYDPQQWVQRRWWGFSKEGGALAVFDSNRFHEKFIGTYYNTYYYDIFLLAAMQRVTLLLLFERLSDIPSLTTKGGESSRILRRLRKDLLLFKNQSWFSQLTNRERGLELWGYWQEVFDNRELLHEVNEQSQELDTYLQSLSRERLDWVVRLGGFLATAVPAILGLPVLFGSAPWVITTRWILLVVLLLGTGVFALRIFRQNNDD